MSARLSNIKRVLRDVRARSPVGADGANHRQSAAAKRIVLGEGWLSPSVNAETLGEVRQPTSD